MRLIDADALKSRLKEEAERMKQKFCEYGLRPDIINWVIDEMPTVEPEQRWIPCSERLPEKGKVVLITNDKGNVRCGQYRGVWSFYERPTEWVWRGNTVETVIAWRPLPDAYEVEK